LPPLELLHYMAKKVKSDPDHVPYIDLKLYCVPSWCKSNKEVRKRERERKYDDAGVDEYTRRAQAAHDASMKVKADEGENMTLSNWHNFFQVYVVAASIVGGRLGPGILLAHQGTMMRVMEALVSRKGAQYRNAFVQYDTEKRREWEFNAEHDVPRWSLSDSAQTLDTVLLAKVERECPLGAGEKPAAGVAAKLKFDLSKTQCYTCFGWGHTSKFCPQGKSQGKGKATQPAGAPTSTALVPFQPAGAGNGTGDKLAGAIQGAFVGNGKGNGGKGKKY
jgi:hypothetical protein